MTNDSGNLTDVTAQRSLILLKVEYARRLPITVMAMFEIIRGYGGIRWGRPGRETLTTKTFWGCDHNVRRHSILSTSNKAVGSKFWFQMQQKTGAVTFLLPT